MFRPGELNPWTVRDGRAQRVESGKSRPALATGTILPGTERTRTFEVTTVSIRAGSLSAASGATLDLPPGSV
jgi:hypothetical protein